MVGAAAAPAAAHQSTGNTRCAEPGGGSIGAEDGGADDEDHEDAVLVMHLTKVN